MRKIHFPLGSIPKPKVREIAKSLGLIVHNKKDSHEICFVPDGDHAKVVERALNKKFSGTIVDNTGKTLGDHKGIHKYTIGQRRGLGVAAGDKLYVADIDSSAQKIVLAKKSALAVTKVAVSHFNFLVPLDKWPANFAIKIRARSAPAGATLGIKRHGDSYEFCFNQEQYAVALGQAAVVYHGNVVLGGGILTGRLDGAFPREFSI